MSRIGIYQTIAGRYGTVIERASEGVAPRIGGGITKHPLARDVAETLVRDLRAIGAEAKILDVDDGQDVLGDRVFVYLAGCSFQKGDLK